MKKKVVLKINGMHCTSCAIDIDGELEDTEGVVCSNTSYAKQKTEVEFEEDKVNLKNLEDKIKNLGYEANPLE